MWWRKEDELSRGRGEGGQLDEAPSPGAGRALMEPSQRASANQSQGGPSWAGALRGLHLLCRCPGPMRGWGVGGMETQSALGEEAYAPSSPPNLGRAEPHVSDPTAVCRGSASWEGLVQATRANQPTSQNLGPRGTGRPV